MSKLAVFVEGQTELIFVERVLQELAGYDSLSIRSEVMHGGAIRSLAGYAEEGGDRRFQALLVNCECDGKVVSAIRDRKESLKAQGYTWIVGLRDLYPTFVRQELPRAKKGSLDQLQDSGAIVDLVFAVHEIEAWFLAEYSHLERLSPALTLDAVFDGTGVNLDTIDVETIPRPARLLENVYEMAGLTYRKRRGDAIRTVNAIDYERMYLCVRDRVAAVNELLTYFEHFLLDAAYGT